MNIELLQYLKQERPGIYKAFLDASLKNSNTDELYCKEIVDNKIHNIPNLKGIHSQLNLIYGPRAHEVFYTLYPKEILHFHYRIKDTKLYRLFYE